MQVTDLLTPDRIRLNAHAVSKKRLLETISKLMVEEESDLSPREVFESLVARERLGSTGLGHGVAIPHGRLKHGDKARAVFIRLMKPIDYDAVDDQPVDLLFALTVPENCNDHHLKLLAKIAELFSDDEFCRRLRQADDSNQLHAVLSDWQH